MGLQPPVLWGTSHKCQPAPPAVPARCQQGSKPVSVLQDASSILPYQVPRSLAPAYGVSSHWCCHQRWHKPPSFMGAVEQDIPVATSKLPGPWRTHPAHIWDVAGAQDSTKFLVLAPQQDSKLLC